MRKSMTLREPPRICKEDVLHIVRCVAETIQQANVRALRDMAQTHVAASPYEALNAAADMLDPDTTTQSRLSLETTIQNMTATTMNWLNESERQHPEGDPNE